MDNYYEFCKLCNSKVFSVNSLHELVKCENCDLIFSKKIFTPKEIIETYDKLYNKSDKYSNHIEQFRLMQLGRRPRIGSNKTRILNKIISKKNQLFLEIGAGVGLTGNYLIKKHHSYKGIEIDHQTAIKAKTLGVNIEEGSFELADKWENKFDSVIAFEVIEHIQDLDKCLKVVHKTLKRDGLFGFTVPNYNKILNYTKDDSRLRQSPPPIHLNFFTIDNIQKIVAHYPFEIQYLKTRRFPYFNLKKRITYKFIVKAIFGLFHGPTILCVLKKK